MGNGPLDKQKAARASADLQATRVENAKRMKSPYAGVGSTKYDISKTLDKTKAAQTALNQSNRTAMRQSTKKPK